MTIMPNLKYMLIIILLAASISLACSYYFFSENSGPSVTISDDVRVIDTTRSLQDTAYIHETIYNGTSLPAELFEIPFRMSKDGQYLSNKELIAYLGESNVNPYLALANKALMLIFAQSGTQLKEKEYTKAVSNLYESSPYIQIGDKTVTPEEYALELYSLYTDNRIHITGDFVTDSSLMWQSEYVYYVRGVMTLELMEDSNGKYKNYFGFTLNHQNKKINLIVQVKFMPGNSDEILGIDILGAID